jgi:histidyl-tRNA synthetase
MAEKKKFQAIKGTRDLLPPETELWNRVEQTAREVFGTFGFGEIRPPIFEPTELFARSIGMDTDVVGKEMYSFEDRDETSVSLRPEATASVCRAYIEHGMHAWPQPVKLYYTGPMFRRERPQKGRYRQFYQIGAEVLEMVPPNQDPGKNIGKDAAMDAEVIEMVMAFFARLGLEGVKLEINSIGDRECRPKYVELLRAELMKVKDKLGPDSQRRIETNPLRVLDSKLESEQAIVAGLPRIADHLCANCAGQYAEVKRQLGMRGVTYAENWRLVRGLDYYMRTTFEITARGLGSQNAVCGGGRYDGLVELLGGLPTKGIGFAIGEDRLILSLQHQQPSREVGPRADVMVTSSGEQTWQEAVRVASSLRQQGLVVYMPNPGTRLNKALESANRQKIRIAIIVGESEMAAGKYVVRILRPFEEEGPRDQQIPTNRLLLYGRLAKLRNDLERKMRGLLGENPQSFKGEGLGKILQRLEADKVLPNFFLRETLKEELRDLVQVLNRALHGSYLTEGSEEWALVVGNLVLAELDRTKTPGSEDAGALQ